MKRRGTSNVVLLREGDACEMGADHSCRASRDSDVSMAVTSPALGRVFQTAQFPEPSLSRILIAAMPPLPAGGSLATVGQGRNDASISHRTSDYVHT